MTAIKNVISKGQLVALNFAQDALAASQTDAQLNRFEVASGATLAVESAYMPFPGEVVAIGWDMSAAGTAGTLTVGATIDGTEDADTTQTITTAQRGYARIPRGKAAFVAGKYLGVEITTSSGWGTTGADLVVTLYVLQYLEGV